MNENDTPPKIKYIAFFWLNRDKLTENSLFQIHFNHTDSSGRFIYKDNQSFDDTRQYIGNVDPIAKGITAFLINTESDLATKMLDNIDNDVEMSKLRLDQIFHRYYTLQHDVAEKNGKTFSTNFCGLDYSEFSDVFIPAHIEEERKLLDEPNDFYSDEFTHIKPEAKVAIRKYAKQYIKFVGKLQDAKYLPCGLPGCLETNQLEKLYVSLTKGKYIKAEQRDFISALTPQPLPINFTSINWLQKNQLGKPNQYKLRALLEVCGIKVDGRSVRKIDVGKCFTDNKGRPIYLGNPKRDNFYEANLRKFRAMLE